MKSKTHTSPGIAASLALAAALAWVGSASAALTITTANQNGPLPFTPTWTPATDSLIAGLVPTGTNGNYSKEATNRTVVSLTAGGSLRLDKMTNAVAIDNALVTTTPNYVTCGNGSGAGSTLVYTLPAATYGYNITNITVFSGWADNGRDAQDYNVSYSTVANPTVFTQLAFVRYNPTVPGGTPSANRVIIDDSTGVPIAVNVAALKFDFTSPSTENGYAGYGAITVGGTAATALTNTPIVITSSNQNSTTSFTPTWAIETENNLILNQQPSSFGGGNFAAEAGVTGLGALTDGTFGTVDSKGSYATCGSSMSAGNFVVYTLNNSANGYDLTNIVVYSGWPDTGRDGQFYNLSYSTVSAPTTFIPLTSAFYNPAVTGISANRVAITSATGAPLARNVYSVKFDFTAQVGADNGYSGYAELVVQGTASAPPTAPPSPYLTQDTLPTYAETVVGDQVIFTAGFSNSPAANLQWQVISGGVTNDIPGATSPTLTLNSVQLTNSGSYRLKAINATNSQGVAYSTASQLVVSNVPAAVGGVIVAYAGQTGPGAASSVTNFSPSWTVNTANDLILNSVNGGGPGSFTPGTGSFGRDNANGDPTLLTDGSFGYFNYWPNVGSSPTEVTCGVSPGGSSMTYTLPDSSTGYDLTNITVYGGWGDSGRNEQKYEVLYSTVAAPMTFNHLVTVDYNPSDPNNTQSATRTTLIPSGVALAQNVAAVQFNFNLQGSAPKNGYEGYSEIVIAGVRSAPKPVLTQDITPLTAADVQGSQLIITAGFSGATSYQWQKDGVDIPGATSQTLTLNNLQLSDTATNSGYVLVARNASGVTSSRGCTVTVNPLPAAVSNVVAAIASQTSDQGTFTPTWDPTALSSSLLWYAYPASTGTGNFNDPDVAHPDTAGGVPVLTDGSYGYITSDSYHTALATCGPTAGQFVTYTLPPSAYGYNLTNISIAGGWNDTGRNSQWYTVKYATVANPTTFLPLAVVTNQLATSSKSMIRATLTPAAGVLASNVVAIMVDFTSPSGVPNGYSGYSEISVLGSPSAADTEPVLVTVANQNTSTPDWVVETNSLIENQLPSSYGAGAFAGSFNGEPAAGGLPVLTDGTFGPFDNGVMNYATCGGAYGAGSSVTYMAASGWNLTNIVVYSGWGNYDRDGQFYTIYYTTLSDPNTPIKLVTVNYNPPALGGPGVNRVAITPAQGGMLATNVHSVTFDFSIQRAQDDNGYSGYAEIVLQGTNLPPALVVTPPTVHAPVVAGGNLILTGAGGTPNSSYTWLTTTNLTAPINWTTNTTGVLDGTGAFSNAIPVNPSQPAGFFRLRMP